MATMLVPSRGKTLNLGIFPIASSGRAAAAAAGATTKQTTTTTTALPSFLAPAWRRSFSGQQRQKFSTTRMRPSKLGRTPISIPPGVELTMGEPRTTKAATEYKPTVKKTIAVTGPLGSLKLDVPEFVNLEQNEADRTAMLSVADADVKQQKEMWGTSWAYLSNHVMGVSEGHTAILRLVGVGYRASVEERGAKEQYPGQRFLCLKLGFTHPIEVGIPPGVKVTTPLPTRVLLEGPDREELMSFAGKVRKWRPPEPYKGKGVFVNNETIRLKQKKIK